MPDYATFKLIVSVLTPVHIGNGRELLNEYDYAVYKGKTWRINEAALLDAQNVDDPALAEHLAQTPPARLLQDNDYVPGSPYFRYIIQGTPRSRGEGAQVHEHLKDIFDRIYIPGSSLKGALRTVLAWYAWGKMGIRPDDRLLLRKDGKFLPDKFAAQNYERTLFVQKDAKAGHEPNFDLFKAFQVSDSQPLDATCLLLMNASVLNLAGQVSTKIPVELEALRANTTFELVLKVDLALFSEWARKSGLRMTGEEWLRNLPQICREYARERIQNEINWFRGINTAKQVLSAYQQIGGVLLAGNQFIMQLGWGTGWDSKTFGSRLKADPQFMETIIGRYRMARGQRKTNDPFPKSRRAAMSYKQSPQGQHIETPNVPLGWVLVTMQPERGNVSWLQITKGKESVLKPFDVKTTVPDNVTTVPVTIPSQSKPSIEKEETIASPPQYISTFKAHPRVGDYFIGEVFDIKGGTLYLSIPGLDDTEAYAIINPEGKSSLKKFKEGDRVTCQATDLVKEPNKTWRVICREV